jgi:uncharacterized protein (DUF983 family)
MENQMSKNRNFYASIFALKCPRCRQGDLFQKKGLLVYRGIIDMPKHCPVCNQKYEIEPGFWIGALWTSYPIVVLIEIPFLALAVMNTAAMGVWAPLLLMLPAFLIAYPLMLRLGRSIWIHGWVKYGR